AHGGYGAVLRERRRIALSRHSRGEEPLRGRERTWRVRDDGKRTEGSAQSVRDLSVEARCTGERQRRHGDSRGQPTHAAGSAGTGRFQSPVESAPRGGGPGAEPTVDVACRASPPRRHRHVRPGRVRQRGRWSAGGGNLRRSAGAAGRIVEFPGPALADWTGDVRRSGSRG